MLGQKRPYELESSNSSYQDKYEPNSYKRQNTESTLQDKYINELRQVLNFKTDSELREIKTKKAKQQQLNQTEDLISKRKKEIENPEEDGLNITDSNSPN